LGPESWSPLIMRSGTAQDSYWANVGNLLLPKCSYFSSAAALCIVPALGLLRLFAILLPVNPGTTLGP
jgi:hypothetical protein